MNQIEAMRQAIKALETYPVTVNHWKTVLLPAATILRQAIEQDQQTDHRDFRVPAPTASAQPLTDKQIVQIAVDTFSAEPGRDGYILPITFARAIESYIKGASL